MYDFLYISYEIESSQALLGVTFSFMASNFRERVHLHRLLLEPTFDLSLWLSLKSPVPLARP